MDFVWNSSFLLPFEISQAMCFTISYPRPCGTSNDGWGYVVWLIPHSYPVLTQLISLQLQVRRPIKDILLLSSPDHITEREKMATRAIYRRWHAFLGQVKRKSAVVLIWLVLTHAGGMNHARNMSLSSKWKKPCSSTGQVSVWLLFEPSNAYNTIRDCQLRGNLEKGDSTKNKDSLFKNEPHFYSI